MKRPIKMRKVSEKTLSAAKDEFLRYHKIKNSSVDTIRYYTRIIDMLITFADDANYLLHNITLEDIEDYTLYLRERDITSTTVNTYLRGIRAFLYHFMERGYIEKFKVSLIKTDERIKVTYTDEELSLLLKKPNLRKCKFAEYRDWAVINFLCATGCRAKTLLNVQADDLDFDNMLIRFRVNKNRKEQIIPMSNSIVPVLKEYLEYRDPKESNDYLFCNQFAEKMNRHSLTSSIRRYCKRRGVEKHSIHLFRHTFAKNWILNGGDIFRLKSILNHSTLDMVKKYVNIYGVELQKDFNKFCLADKLSSNKEKLNIV